MEDRFSDPAADIESEYADKEYWWKINIEYAKDTERINADIAAQEA